MGSETGEQRFVRGGVGGGGSGSNLRLTVGILVFTFGWLTTGFILLLPGTEGAVSDTVKPKETEPNLWQIILCQNIYNLNLRDYYPEEMVLFVWFSLLWESPADLIRHLKRSGGQWHFSSRWTETFTLHCACNKYRTALHVKSSSVCIFVLLLVFKSFFFLKFFWVATYTSPILEPLMPLFSISGDVSSGFQRTSGFCLICIAEANVMYISWNPPFMLNIANLLMVSNVGFDLESNPGHVR